MELLPIIYLGYMFVSIYFLSLFLLLYFKNRKHLFDYPSPTRKYKISFVVPAYNEGNSIAEAIETIFNSEYPLHEVIVVNDGSTDNTREVVESLLGKYPKLRLINNEKNLGNAARSQNVGLKYVTGDIVAVVDGDSFPSKDAVSKMVGFFDDENVGAVTCPSRARNHLKFIERLQAIEYNVIAFTRKLLDYVDAIYVTPGTLALYRKKALDEIGGFDENNMTQDIEATWNLTSHGWQRRMSLSTYVATNVPTKFKAWYKQRRRWNIGGLQCINKYKSYFLKHGMLGFFILPFFVLQLFLGLIGLSIFVYLVSTRFISNFIYTKYSLAVGTPLITMNDLFITPSFLNYLGIILFVVGAVFTLGVLYVMQTGMLKKQNVFNLLFYLLFYLSIYPLIMISALYYFFKGGAKWR